MCVGTPPTYSGDADLSAVWRVVDELPPPEERSLLVMKSTVPVGTGEKVRAALEARRLPHVGYVSNPEFLSEGTAVRDFMEPDRVVVGAYAEADADIVSAPYEPLGSPIVRTDVASAEMIKLAANAALMTRISFINEIANVCEATGADVVQVAEGIGLDHRLGPHFLRAGIGWGGSCFPKDGVALKQLASNSGYHFQLLNAVIEVNELQKRRVIGKLEKHLGKLRGKTVALLGLAQAEHRRPPRGSVARPRLASSGRGCRRARMGSGRGREQPPPGRHLLRQRDRRGDRCRRRRDRHRVGRAPLACLGRGAPGDAHARARGRAESPRSRGGASRWFHLRGDRPRVLVVRRASGHRGTRARAPAIVEAIIWRRVAERAGDAAQGRLKALVEIGGRPLAACQVEQLAAVGVQRVIVSCAAGQEELFEAALGGIGPDIVAVGEPEPLGRGGGIRFAAVRRRERGDVFALNGDELVDVDLQRLLDLQRSSGAAATITVVPLRSPFGIVELEGDVVTGFREAPRLEHWVSCGIYVLAEEALERFPERGDHETSTFPELAAEQRLYAHRHEGIWLTVNTPKDLRVAEEYLAAHPDWPAPVTK